MLIKANSTQSTNKNTSQQECDGEYPLKACSSRSVPVGVAALKGLELTSWSRTIYWELGCTSKTSSKTHCDRILILLYANHYSFAFLGNSNVIRRLTEVENALVVTCVIVQGELIDMAEPSQ